MKLKFFGPLGRVTGSATLLMSERLGVRILVDAGLQQGEGDVDPWNSGPLPFDASKLTHVILTHAHIDHCGLLPRLFEDGFTGRVLCTPETAALTRPLLADCARVSGLFTQADVCRVRFDERDVRFGQHFPIARDVFVQFFRSAHILGAVSARVCWGKRGSSQRSIVFSGDLGTNVDRHERFLFLRDRMSPPASDFAVVESTYGGRDRGIAPEQCFVGRVEALRVELRAAIQKGGTILVPVFATERLQTMLLDLAYLCSIDAEIANTPVFAHTPLGRAISTIHLELDSFRRHRWGARARQAADPNVVAHEVLVRGIPAEVSSHACVWNGEPLHRLFVPPPHLPKTRRLARQRALLDHAECAGQVGVEFGTVLVPVRHRRSSDSRPLSRVVAPHFSFGGNGGREGVAATVGVGGVGP